MGKYKYTKDYYDNMNEVLSYDSKNPNNNMKDDIDYILKKLHYMSIYAIISRKLSDSRLQFYKNNEYKSDTDYNDYIKESIKIMLKQPDAIVVRRSLDQMLIIQANWIVIFKITTLSIASIADRVTLDDLSDSDKQCIVMTCNRCGATFVKQHKGKWIRSVSAEKSRHICGGTLILQNINKVDTEDNKC